MKKASKEIIILWITLAVAIILNICSVIQYNTNGHPINWSTYICSYAIIAIAFDYYGKKNKQSEK